MRVRLVYNASSGYGKAAATVRRFSEDLTASGHVVDVRPSGRGSDTWHDLARADLLVLMGGDGTVHHALSHALAARVAVYQVPTGTENLFARDWGMDAQVATLWSAMARGRLIEADTGECGGRPFALMTSVGLDAAIIQARCGGVRRGDGHLGYVIPMLEQLAEPVFPTLRVIVDGEVVIDGQCGVAIVANSRQYAMRLDPAIRASNTDGLLDLVFLPCASVFSAITWTLLARLRRHTGAGRMVYRTGRRIIIESLSGPLPCQIDGEPLGKWPADGRDRLPGASPALSSLQFTIHPRTLRVLDARPDSANEHQP